MIGRARDFGSWQVASDLHAQFLLLIEESGNKRWRWNMHLDGQYAWTAGNDLSLLDIDVHLTLRRPHLVDTGLVVWDCTQMRSTIRTVSKIIEDSRSAFTTLECFCIEDSCHHPLKRIVLAYETRKHVPIFAKIPGEGFEIGMTEQFCYVGEREAVTA